MASMIRSLVLAAVVCVFAGSDTPRAFAGGPTGEAAPKWEVKTWANIPEGRSSYEVTDFRGRVLCLFNFQSW